MTKSYRCKKCNSAPQHCNCHRTDVEKCPHRNPQGQCPQCNLVQSLGYQEETKPKEPEILSKVREFLNQEKESESFSEDAISFVVTKKIIQEEKPDWPGRIWGMVFLLIIR